MSRKLLAAVCVALAIITIFAGTHLFLKDDTQHLAIQLQPDNQELVALGADLYAENCAACHGAQLEGQLNWRQRNADGRLPAPPHDETGHTWHHPDDYLFFMTKFGLERMIGKRYPNNMPAFEGSLSDEEIQATLSFIKSTWPEEIRRRHDRINQQNALQ
ncbi:cytochrome c [Kiloniella sp. b19]|uniref:cytochrome c n=1 Tax=Kiloniella sp. GXU_MW_B19 TaxID=3141326 RepID=UPI0031D1E824